MSALRLSKGMIAHRPAHGPLLRKERTGAILPITYDNISSLTGHESLSSNNLEMGHGCLPGITAMTALVLRDNTT